MRSPRIIVAIVLLVRSGAVPWHRRHARPGRRGLSEPADPGDRAGRRRRRPRHRRADHRGGGREASRPALIIENKPGAGQRIGAAMVAKAPPTATRCCSPRPRRSRSPSTFRRSWTSMPAKDFQPVAIGGLSACAAGRAANLGVKTVDEFIAYAKEQSRQAVVRHPGPRRRDAPVAGAHEEARWHQHHAGALGESD